MYNNVISEDEYNKQKMIMEQMLRQQRMTNDFQFMNDIMRHNQEMLKQNQEMSNHLNINNQFPF